MAPQREEIEALRAFHGHLGPFAMLGYRAGRLALNKLEAEPHFGISARVHCPPQPPPSCFADGVQYSTGCTLGKANIELIPAEEISLTVTVADSGAAVTITPRREVIERFGPWMEEADDETAALRVLRMSEEELFEG
ncbi:MAG: formylmethanofuran dehydrogenase subunit E family protein [Armatimonadota bacterium]|nr:formylmethanofuran dehydrogenase subunit E family protein [Armatimonadota bacterium]